MREFSEPSMRNLFRRPLVMGVSFTGLLALAFLVLTLMIFLGSSKAANAVTAAVALSGYISLRVCNRFMIEGWEVELLYPLEKKLWKKGAVPEVERIEAEAEIQSPDTLEKIDMIFEKEKLAALLSDLKAKESITLEFKISEKGAVVSKLISRGSPHKLVGIDQIYPTHKAYPFGYSLKSPPVNTNPLTMFETLSRLEHETLVLIRVSGLGYIEAKAKVEASRKRNARTAATLQNIDSEVSFAETSKVLELMSKGEETIAESSFLLLTTHPELIDPAIFHLEKNIELCLLSILGIRKRHFRSHILRLLTICDLIPNLMDPNEKLPSILKSIRGKNLYFSPQDSRLEALHWLVVGATGTGKSFFTGAVLSRLITEGVPMSVLYVDHNRSFKRLVRMNHGIYLEPQDLEELKLNAPSALQNLANSGTVAGVELSDLLFDEKKDAAFFILSQIESFLRKRVSTHPVYIVLDECWNFLRDEPVMVQRAFREFRKLNGAVVAITQSLSDFLSDTSGKSILQNAPIRILLRQGEDPVPYKGVLGLNDVEVQKLRLLKQKKGQFSECLIKTSFLSKIARLYPTAEEYEILRTDNLRGELLPPHKPQCSEVGNA